MGYVIHSTTTDSSYGLSDGEWSQLAYLAERGSVGFVGEHLQLDAGERIVLSGVQARALAGALRSALERGEIVADTSLYDIDRLDRASGWALLGVLESGRLRVRRTMPQPSPIRRFSQVAS